MDKTFKGQPSSALSSSRYHAGPRMIEAPMMIVSTPKKAASRTTTGLSEKQINKAMIRRKSKEAANRNKLGNHEMAYIVSNYLMSRGEEDVAEELSAPDGRHIDTF